MGKMSENTPTFWQHWQSRVRWMALGMTGLVFATFLLQNFEQVEFHLLLSSVAMPKAIMLLLVAAIAFGCGALWRRSGQRF